MKKTLIWKVLFVIGLCPFAAPFFYYLLQIFAHGNSSWTIVEMIVLWSFLYWPTYLIGLLLVTVALCMLKT